jgi:hypothetical protein
MIELLIFAWLFYGIVAYSLNAYQFKKEKRLTGNRLSLALKTIPFGIASFYAYFEDGKYPDGVCL